MNRKPAYAFSPQNSTRNSPGTSQFWGRDSRQSATVGAVAGSAEGPSGTQLHPPENEWNSEYALEEVTETSALTCSHLLSWYIVS